MQGKTRYISKLNFGNNHGGFLYCCNVLSNYRNFLITVLEFLTGKDFERKDLPRNEIAVLKVINFVFLFLSATTIAISVLELIWHTGASESVNSPTDILYFTIPFLLRTRFAHIAKIMALILVDI